MLGSIFPAPWPPRRIRRRLGLLVVVPGLGFALSACGGGGPATPGVASIGSTTTTARAGEQSGNEARNYSDAVTYAGCMRTHGVPDFPDPDRNGDFLLGAKAGGQSGVIPGSRQFQQANKACSHLLPNGGQMTPGELQQAIAKALKFVQCMRSHGVPNMPDPKATSSGIAIGGRGLDPRSAMFQAAQAACRSLSPFGGA
jgi:hypothetical protein